METGLAWQKTWCTEILLNGKDCRALTLTVLLPKKTGEAAGSQAKEQPSILLLVGASLLFQLATGIPCSHPCFQKAMTIKYVQSSQLVLVANCLLLAGCGLIFLWLILSWLTSFSLPSFLPFLPF